MIKQILILAATTLAAPVLAQDAASTALPMCSAKVKDSCQQTPAQQARAMSGAQADARDAKTGTWTPNSGGSDKDAMAAAKPKHHGHKHSAKKTTTTTTTTETPK